MSVGCESSSLKLRTGMIPEKNAPDYHEHSPGLTAAAANIFGGAIIVQRHWERRYLRYFVAIGAGFMLDRTGRNGSGEPGNTREKRPPC